MTKEIETFEHVAVASSPEAAVSAMERMDEIEEALQRFPQVKTRLTHTFTPGLYTRTIFMPAGALIISKIHNTEHPFVVVQGDVLVWLNSKDKQRVIAPHMGITKPGTRRLLLVLSDTIWTTFHPTTETDLEKIESDIIFRPEPKLKNHEQNECLALP